MLERLKLQQDQVARMTRELSDARENLGEMRAHQLRLNDLMIKSDAECSKRAKKIRANWHNIKGELEMLKERESEIGNA